jgi:hypothetical protein
MAPIAGFFALLDTAIGTMTVAFFGLGLGLDRAIAISFLLAFPMYVLDLLIKRRLAISLLSLLVCRWALLSFGTWPPHPTDLFAWPMGILLTLSFVFLQLSRLRPVKKSAQDSR